MVTPVFMRKPCIPGFIWLTQQASGYITMIVLEVSSVYKEAITMLGRMGKRVAVLAFLVLLMIIALPGFEPMQAQAAKKKTVFV